jgi:hypothetical protein
LRLAAVGAALLFIGSLALVVQAAPTPEESAGKLAQMTSTPARPPTGDKDGVTPPSGRPPTTGLTLNGGDTGRVTATITLEGPSGAQVFASLRAGDEAGPLSQAALAAMWQAVRNALSQQQLIAALTAPDIGATIIGQSQIAANSVTVQVDAAAIPSIRGLPGVRSVTINVPEVIDPIRPPPDELDLGEQPPGDQLD